MGWVGLVRQSGGELAVLKVLSTTGQRDEGAAAAVLQAFDGKGVVRVLHAAPGALLMEYCERPILLDVPGGDQDHIAVPILCDVVRRMREVRAARPTAVPTLTERCRALGALPSTSLASEDAYLIEAARNVSRDLLQSDTANLLHGDLHQENVMRTRRHGLPTWVAIDPQGLWGDPAIRLAIRSSPTIRVDQRGWRTNSPADWDFPGRVFFAGRLCTPASRLYGRSKTGMIPPSPYGGETDQTGGLRLKFTSVFTGSRFTELR